MIWLARPFRRLAERFRFAIRQRRYDAIAARHLEQRLASIKSELAAASPGFVFLVGNSHAELLGPDAIEGCRVVNGGIGGTSARGYAAQLCHLPFSTRASVAVLWIGTNDILRGRISPLSDARGERFDASVARIVTWLGARADAVLVAAVPPIGTTDADREPAAVLAYCARLERLSADHGCRFFDPFSDIRDGMTGWARPGAMQDDGVHLADYRHLRVALASFLGGMVTEPQHARNGTDGRR